MSATAAIHPQTKTPDAPAMRDPLAIPKILLVDDDPDVSRAIELRLEGYRVVVMHAYHGAHGVALALEEQPHCIITDLSMPQGDGLYLLRALKQDAATAAIPVVVLTGHPTGEARAELMQYGAARILSKPIAVAQLLRELGRFIPLRKDNS